jgi:hypothetical protein
MNKKIQQMKRVTKENFLMAAETILREYKKESHRISKSSCMLCELYNKEYTNFNECTGCPMYVFKGDHYYPCMSRSCEPVGCYPGIKKTKRLQRVIEFYETVIKAVQEMPEFNKAKLMKLLKKINDEVAAKYVRKLKSNTSRNSILSF